MQKQPYKTQPVFKLINSRIIQNDKTTLIIVIFQVWHKIKSLLFFILQKLLNQFLHLKDILVFFYYLNWIRNKKIHHYITVPSWFLVSSDIVPPCDELWNKTKYNSMSSKRASFWYFNFKDEFQKFRIENEYVRNYILIHIKAARDIELYI